MSKKEILVDGFLLAGIPLISYGLYLMYAPMMFIFIGACFMLPAIIARIK